VSTRTSTADLAPEAAETLAALLDEIVPARDDGRLPGAGALGLGPHVARAAAEKPELAALLTQGLAALDALVRTRGDAHFAELARADRLEALAALGAEAPAFLPTLAFLTYAGYYRDPRVLEAVGHEPRPPYPKGYALPATDFALLDPVRARRPFYRTP
jgi:hypothetical protein